MRAIEGWALFALPLLACGSRGSSSTDAPRSIDAPVDVLPDTLSVIPSLRIGAGLFFSCALKPDGSAECWGYGMNGTIGNGSTADATKPTAVLNLTGALTLTVQGYNACVLAADRTVECWGNDFDGQLGDNGTLGMSAVPVLVPTVSDAVQVSTGGEQDCALHANTTVECWGGLGVLTVDYRPAPIKGLAGVVKMAPTTSDHRCVVINDGSLRCWGADYTGQLGDGRSGRDVKSDVPVQVQGIAGATDVAVSYGDTCALLADHTVWCWGDNSRGQLGNGSSATMSLVPVQVSGLANVVQLSTSDYYGCATKSDGTAWCWGDNSFGSLGNGTTTNSNVPVKVSGISNVVGVACGNEHACAQLADASLWCWGGNNSYGLGSMTTMTCPQGACSTTPIKVTL